MTEDEYLINEIAEETGVSTRTIRFYQQEGLLPKPDYQGKRALYHKDHLMRLKLIQVLKDKFLPLKEIREHLNSLNSNQVQALLERQTIEETQKARMQKLSDITSYQKDSDTALEYISRLLETQSELRVQAPLNVPSRLFNKFDSHQYVAGSPSESWRRITLAPGLEIQIQEPLSPKDQKRLEELIKFTRKLFQKEQK